MTAVEPFVRACLAPAKVNLTLHLCGQRADGYHLLDSLVVFPEIGDHLSAEPASGLSLTISGPFGDALASGGDNLVLKAAERLSEHVGGAGAALHLQKNLPVASGIGGGSSDAAAALRLLSEMWEVSVPPGLTLALGADVPVCCAAPAPQRMQGIGERLSPVPPLPEHWMVLVNPLVGVPTGAVFAGVADRSPPQGPALPPKGFRDFKDLRDWVAAGRNDLQASATTLCPPIAEILAALGTAPLARMSGSGATCYALFEDEVGAEEMAIRLRREADWWVAMAPVTGVSGAGSAANARRVMG